MKFYKYNLIVILFFALYFLTTIGSPVSAQKQNNIDLNRLVHIGMEQGLSSNKINCILQDKKGFMWFGTDYGLNRFDGYNFKVFTKIKDDSLSLTDNDIRCITQDAAGNIWIGTLHGLNVMDYKTGKISRFISKIKSDPFWKYDINITALSADDSSVWIGTDGGGLIEYKIFKQELKKYVKAINETDSLTNNFVINSLIVENNGNILGGAGFQSHYKGLLELNVKTGILNRIFLERKLIKQKTNFIEYSSNDAVETIYKDAKGNIYIGTNGGSTSGEISREGFDNSYQLDDYEGKSFFRNVSDTDFKEIKMVNSSGLTNGTKFLEYKPGKILFSNGAASGVFNLKNNQPQLLNTEPLSYPKGIHIEKVFKDRSGKLWFITSGGIETLEPLALQHKVFSLNGIRPNSIVEDIKGIIWLGSDNKSLVSFNVEKNKLESYKLNENNNFEFVNAFSPTSGKIYGIYKFDPYEFNKNSKSFKRVADLKSSVTPKNMNFGWNELYSTSNGSLWIRVENKGIAKLNPETGKMHYIVPEDTIYGGEHSGDKPYFDDGKENLYVSNTSQIIGINYKTDSYKVFDITKSGLKGIVDGITSITKDYTGNIWLATRNQGLEAFNLQSQKIYKFTVGDGLPTNTTSRILFVNGAIWVNHPNGIYKFIPPKNLGDKTQKPVIKAYGVKDGLPNINFAANAMIKCSDGKILLSADSLLISFYPDSIQSNEYVPPVVITSLQVNNRIIEAGDSTKILLKNISSTDSIHLTYLQNSLSLEYAALNYIHSEENEYAYKMEGVDTSWTYCGKRRFVTYSNLAPGEYTFHAKGSNNDGIWSEEEAKFTIIILPPWWKTSAAYLIYIIVFAVCILGLIRFRTSALLKQKKILEKKVEERTTELKQSLNNLKSTQSQLIQSEKMASLGELTEGIAHEIQNPLNFVNNFSEVNKELLLEMKDEIDKGNINEVKSIADDLISNQEKINHHGKRADEIVKGMMQHSIASTGQKEPTNINALADEYLRLSYHGMRAKDKEFNATIKTDFDEGIGKIDIIPQDIGRVLLNLYNNAFYSLAEKNKLRNENYEPTISVSTKKIINKVEIRVKDNGNVFRKR